MTFFTAQTEKIVHFIKFLGKQAFEGDIAISRVSRNRAREIESDKALEFCPDKFGTILTTKLLILSQAIKVTPETLFYNEYGFK